MAILKGWQVDSCSKSDLVTFDMCGEKYRRQKLMGEWMPMGWAGIRGISVHKAVEVNSKHKIEKGDDLKLSVLEDTFNDEWKAQAQKREEQVLATGYDPDKPGEGDEPVNVQELQTEGRGFVQVYTDQVAPLLMPTACETPFEVKMEINGKPVRLRGIIDMMCSSIENWEARKLSDGTAILDFKTTDKKPKNEAWRSFELVVYSAAMQEITGQLPDQVGLVNLVKMKTQAYATLDHYVPTQAHVDRLKNRMSVFFKAVHAEAFHPASLMFGAWWCSPQFCGFWKTCGLRPQ